MMQVTMPYAFFRFLAIRILTKYNTIQAVPFLVSSLLSC